MFSVRPATDSEFAWAQQMVRAHHYLRKPVDPRSRPLAYVVRLDGIGPVGCLTFGRPEATRCYAGGLTYGSQSDVVSGRARFDRWEVLNLARVWLSPVVQAGGDLCRPELVPGFHDRKGVFRSALASRAIGRALELVGFDYLMARPPVFVGQPYMIRAVLNYCDTRLHRGAIYQAAGFELARTNGDGIQTWWTPAVAPLTPDQDRRVLRAAAASGRGARIRAKLQNTVPSLFGWEDGR